MYKLPKFPRTTIQRKASYEGEPIEKKVRRIFNNKEPITDSAPIIFTERKDGVQPQFNIRTDRMEVALDAMDIASKIHTAKREERHKPKENKPTEGQKTEGAITPKPGGTENVG